MRDRTLTLTAFHTQVEITSVLKLLTPIHNLDLSFLQEGKNKVGIIKLCLTSDLDTERQESEGRAV